MVRGWGRQIHVFDNFDLAVICNKCNLFAIYCMGDIDNMFYWKYFNFYILSIYNQLQGAVNLSSIMVR